MLIQGKSGVNTLCIHEHFDAGAAEIRPRKAGSDYNALAKEADDYTVVFLNDDNTETMYLFAEPVKYTDEYGNKKDKSTALTLKNNDYTMAENDISVSFPREVTNGISIFTRQLHKRSVLL